MLNPRLTPGSKVMPLENGWRLEIPAGPAHAYRLAQLDDYSTLQRSRFPLTTSASLSLRCRASEPSLPGTWGFGFWNDPFSVSFGLGGMGQRLPVLPNAAWFFHASARNHLSLNNLPGNGFLAQSFSAPKTPALLLAPGLLALPLLFSKRLSRWIRAVSARIIAGDGMQLTVSPTAWHTYGLRWRAGHVEYTIDGALVFETTVSPRGPLGTVIWIDSQFAAFTPEGQVRMGSEANPVPAWIEITDLELSS